MYLSQFKLYQSSDVGAPIFYGTSGSLVDLLDACLVNGYGSKSGAGWIKPFPNTGNKVGCYKMNTGSLACLIVQDNGPGIHAAREARIWGCDSLFTNDSGSNPFPSGSQGVGQTASGSYVIARKSADNTTIRDWRIFADSSSLYCFIRTGDPTITTAFYTFAFGDIYSLATGSDPGRAIIIGRITEGNTAIAADRLDAFGTNLTTATTGHFMAHTWTGAGISITVGKHGDYCKGSRDQYIMYGTITPLNPINNGYYVAPVWVYENSNSSIRGRMRGFWHLCHPIANFGDNQIMSGSSGRVYHIVKPSANAGVFCMEVSPTVETF